MFMCALISRRCPKLFNIFLVTAADIARMHDLLTHFYDWQDYLSFRNDVSSDMKTALRIVFCQSATEHCNNRSILTNMLPPMKHQMALTTCITFNSHVIVLLIFYPYIYPQIVHLSYDILYIADIFIFDLTIRPTTFSKK